MQVGTEANYTVTRYDLYSNLVTAGGAQPTTAKAGLCPQCVEGSTVEPMTTMVAMIAASRAHQMNATLLGLADSTLGRAVNDIARLR